MKNKKIFIGDKIKLFKELYNFTTLSFSKQSKIGIETIKNYETNRNEPSINSLIKLSNALKVSIDFLLLWDDCSYIRNTSLLFLAERIDKMEQTERYQIESTAKSLMGDQKTKQINVKLDKMETLLTNNIHENIKLMFENNKEITSKQVSEKLQVDASMISSYRTRTKPPAEKLIKLSEIFDTSIHALVTGKKLNYKFENKGLKEAVLKADKFLSLEQHKFLIQLMEAIIKNQPATS